MPVPPVSTNGLVDPTFDLDLMDQPLEKPTSKVPPALASESSSSGLSPLDPSSLESLAELLRRTEITASPASAFTETVQNKSTALELVLARGFGRLAARVDSRGAILSAMHFEGDLNTQVRLLYEGFETLRAGADVLRDHELLTRLMPQQSRPPYDPGKAAVRSGLLELVRGIDSSRWVPLDMDVDPISNQMAALVMMLGNLIKTAEHAQAALDCFGIDRLRAALESGDHLSGVSHDTDRRDMWFNAQYLFNNIIRWEGDINGPNFSEQYPMTITREQAARLAQALNDELRSYRKDGGELDIACLVSVPNGFEGVPEAGPLPAPPRSAIDLKARRCEVEAFIRQRIKNSSLPKRIQAYTASLARTQVGPFSRPLAEIGAIQYVEVDGKLRLEVGLQSSDLVAIFEPEQLRSKRSKPLPRAATIVVTGNGGSTLVAASSTRLSSYAAMLP
jgi:hypothetical protein